MGNSYKDEYNEEMNYNNNSFMDEEYMGYRLGFILIMTLTAIIVIGILTLMYKLYTSYRKSKPKPASIKLLKRTGLGDENNPYPESVYANEITPGYVLLQTQDGEFFRILQEYDAQTELVNSGHSAYGSVGWRAIAELDSLHFSPDMTSTYYQTSVDPEMGDCERDHLISYDNK